MLSEQRRNSVSAGLPLAGEESSGDKAGTEQHEVSGEQVVTKETERCVNCCVTGNG